jgi:hypothetical protein
MYVYVYVCLSVCTQYTPNSAISSPSLDAVKKGITFDPTGNRAPVLRSFFSQRSHYTDPPHPQFSPHKHKSCLNICLHSAGQQRPRDQQLLRQLLIHKIRPSNLWPDVA